MNFHMASVDRTDHGHPHGLCCQNFLTFSMVSSGSLPWGYLSSAVQITDSIMVLGHSTGHRHQHGFQ